MTRFDKMFVGVAIALVLSCAFSYHSGTKSCNAEVAEWRTMFKLQRDRNDEAARILATVQPDLPDDILMDRINRASLIIAIRPDLELP